MRLTAAFGLLGAFLASACAKAEVAEFELGALCVRCNEEESDASVAGAGSGPAPGRAGSNGGGTSGDAEAPSGTGAGPDDSGLTDGGGDARRRGEPGDSGFGGSDNEGIDGAVSGGASGEPGGVGGASGMTGQAGGGGAFGGEPTCGDADIPPRTSWTLSASHFCGPDSGCDADEIVPDLATAMARVVDGDGATRWTTGKPQSGDEWFLIDLGVVATIQTVLLSHTGSPDDFPAHFRLRVSETQSGVMTAAVAVEGAGTSGTTIATLPAPVDARFILISQTESRADWWSIHGVYVVCTP